MIVSELFLEQASGSSNIGQFWTLFPERYGEVTHESVLVRRSPPHHGVPLFEVSLSWSVKK